MKMVQTAPPAPFSQNVNEMFRVDYFRYIRIFGCDFECRRNTFNGKLCVTQSRNDVRLTFWLDFDGAYAENNEDNQLGGAKHNVNATVRRQFFASISI